LNNHLVDTDLLVDVLRGNERAREILQGLADEGIAISLIMHGELFEGAVYGRDREVNVNAVRALISSIDLLGSSESTVEQFAIYRGALSRHLRAQIGDIDILIAATAAGHDLTLVTGNFKDFAHFEGLRVTNSRTL